MAKPPPPFTIKPLTKDADFFSDARSGFFLIEGSGQGVYWRKCYVLIFKTGETKTPMESHAVCDGQGVIPEGLDVFFGGPNGKVKEVANPPREEEDRVKCHVCNGTGYIEKDRGNGNDEACDEAHEEAHDEAGGKEEGKDVRNKDEKVEEKIGEKEDEKANKKADDSVKEVSK
ncbi:hypothetical protein PT974_08762 [Cladobotryum mycophilum]|uniref:Uncharacterized protein n=1 Tax=Cladobotryum mycophilum TaxID=491253 RepID=A0ABR0SED6_9HYPO